MRKAGGWRWRGWRGIFLVACFAMGGYIAFDLLDLDGSQLRDLNPGNAITAEPVQAETERFFQDGVATPRAFDLARIPAALWSRLERFQSTSVTLPVPPTHHLVQMRPRTQVGREISFADTSSDEPA